MFQLLYQLKRNENTCPHKDLFANVYSSVTHYSPKWKQLKCLSSGEWTDKMWDSHIMKYSSLAKGTSYWYMLSSRGTSKTLYLVKEARHKRPHNIWFHWYEMSRKGKYPEMESGLVLHRAGGRNGHGGPYRGREKCSKTYLWSWLHSLVNLLKFLYYIL